MDPALLKLLSLRLRSGMRYRLKELKSPRGIIFALIAVGVIAMLLWRPASFSEQWLPAALSRGQLVDLIALGLIGTCALTVLTSSGPAFYFGPAEISLLFAGPFTRRGLLLYKFSFYAVGALLSGLIIGLVAVPYAGSFLAAFMGSFTMLVFVQLLSATLTLAGVKLSRRGTNTVQWKFVLLILSALAIVGIWLFSRTQGGFLQAVSALHASPLGVVMMAPFRVFAETFLAANLFPDLVLWTAIALAINGVLLIIAVRLDAHTDELSIAACETARQRWSRAGMGGYLWTLGQSAAYSFRCPTRFGGMGPIAWRQTLNVLRSSIRIVAAFVILMLAAGPLLVAAGPYLSTGSRIGLIFFLCVFVLPRTLVFDFRSDLNNMEILKALPLRPWSICAGQVMVPVLLTSVIELALIGSALPFLQGKTQIVVALLAAFTLPFNLLMYSLENAFYLMFPTSLVPVGRIDFDFFGRTLVELTVKSLLLGVACGLAVSVGFLAFQITNRDWFVFSTVSWLSLSLIAVASLPLLAWAYRRYDVGREAHVA